MPSVTPQQGFPVPVSTDDPNVAEDVTNLALAIEKRVFGTYTNIADRNARVTSPEEGQVAYTKDTNSFTYFDGIQWATMFQQPPSFTSGTSVPSNAVGIDGDVFFKV